MVIRYLYLTLIITFLHAESNSQNDSGRYSRDLVYIEFLGAGGLGSLNYERLIWKKKEIDLGVRVGISSIRFRDHELNFNPDIIIPITVNGTWGKDHKAELGIGQTITNVVQAASTDGSPERKTDVHLNFNLGYRYKKDKGGLILRFGYTPIIESYREFRHWGGISIGWAIMNKE